MDKYMKNYKKIKGFSLIELMVSLTIMAVLLAVSAPFYSSWLMNMRIKNIAEGINLGIVQARSEAIRRNGYITFTLNSDSSWSVKTINDDLINQKKSHESSNGVLLTIGPTGSNVITFNGFGAVTSNIDASPPISSVVISGPISMSGIVPYTVKIGSGGGTLVCYLDCATRTVY